MTADNLQTIWITIIILSCATTWTIQEILFSKIKKKYPQKWIEIGEPGWKRVFSQDFSKFKKARLTFLYLIRGDKQLDADLEIRKLKNITKLVYILILLVVLSFFALVVILNPSQV